MWFLLRHRRARLEIGRPAGAAPPARQRRREPEDCQFKTALDNGRVQSLDSPEHRTPADSVEEFVGELND